MKAQRLPVLSPLSVFPDPFLLAPRLVSLDARSVNDNPLRVSEQPPQVAVPGPLFFRGVVLAFAFEAIAGLILFGIFF